MKRKALAIVLTLLMLVSVLPMGAFAASYTDTEGHWAEKSIDRWTEAKVLEGMGDNIFAPDEYLTRAQAMTIFSRLLKLTEKADISKLTDVAADAWYAPYIETGYAYQIINGTSDTTFDPEGNITREQFFSVFARAVGIPPASTCDKTFTDLDQVSSWFVEEGTVYSMINRGYLDGYPDGSLQPQRFITRAEVAKVLDNAISDYITEDGTYAISGDGIVVVLAKNVKLTGDFNGHIVSSCADSTLDLAGLKGTPYIYVLQDNTKIINAKPGTKVAVNPAADNVTVNGVKVTYNPYVPGSPYIVPSAGGGGGGGGGGETPYNYTVRAVLSVDNATKSHYGFDLKKDYEKVSSTNAPNIETVINDLFKGDNASTIQETYRQFYDRFIPDSEQTWTNGSYSLTMKSDGSFTLYRGSVDKTEKYVNGWTERFEANAMAAADAAGVPAGAARDAVLAFVKAVNPSNIATNAGQIVSPDNFLDQYWNNAVDKGVAMLKALQAANFQDYDKLFSNMFTASSKCNIDSFVGVGVDDGANFLPKLSNYDNNVFTFVAFNDNYNSAAEMLAATKIVIPASGDLSDQTQVKAFVDMIDAQDILNLAGTTIDFKVTVERS